MGVNIVAEISYLDWNEAEVKQKENEFHETLDVLKWAYTVYDKDDIVYACSFGAEAIVLIDLIYRVNRYAKLIFLDTSLHFDETYELIEKVKRRYPELRIELVRPTMSLAEQRELYRDKLWQTDPNKCCYLRKVVPLHHELTGISAWISGLRREQSVERQQTNFINKDDKFQAIKICPLIHWTWKEVWEYILLHELDYIVLHDNGYPSIGCAPCTAQATDPKDLRSGRWTQAAKTECGLHLDNKES